ncbi:MULTISPECIES: RlmE family RNA methyltransferase [Pandoraea]|jgi:23S rRNA (uridine2552-2'-O)-methyltransferase|uniref:Ribosomal RNA large subunit methyltransferase E n=2 Tax=Pandoraea TaxID=93217 RepID=A0A378YFY7_9BURK|nr:MULTISPECIES: RlmE family RNA methyltransferase [Pandoraea]AHB05258.1 23S rRNA methyltransferase [Pandoraea pnomenusa 3kgm]AHB74369.1 23S rRNA methyltransferase [Pandoraea pnomenusa]AHN73037.1 23S rRNA methyltransferase [Pandoraea pnomenusa]AIU26176.1 23S rRNA methyltransferase [Pandoraea pnomenusa]ANC43408.1 23S rRNA methyltransferase [Pandoraea pnomenusa]
MAKNRFSHAWLHDHINDPYVKMAQREGYRARAAYKLKEIDEQDRLIKPGQVIVDLGSTPGSWSQYARNKLAKGNRVDGGIDGTIIALDILPMEPIADVHFLQGDFREDSVLEQLEEIVAGRKVDLVVSDMAPNLSGVASADAARIEHLCDLALDFAQRHLKPEGALLVKCFHGSGYSQIVEKFKQQFKTVAPRKPKASRDKSSETFILGRGLKKPA